MNRSLFLICATVSTLLVLFLTFAKNETTHLARKSHHGLSRKVVDGCQFKTFVTEARGGDLDRSTSTVREGSLEMAISHDFYAEG